MSTTIRLLVAAAIIGLAGSILFGHKPAHGQTLVPLAAKSDPSACAPGYFGEVWPGSKSELMRRGEFGWYAYAWCRLPDGSARFTARACAHGECPSMASIGQQIGTLVVQAVGLDRLKFVQDYMAANPLIWRCAVLPPGQLPPVQATDPPLGSPRSRACNELRQLMAADWPMVAASAPPPPPPASAPWVATHAVKANPSAADGSRPLQVLNADGTLGRTIGRAAAGTDCDTRLPTRASVNTDVYATPVGRAAREVALCARKATPTSQAPDPIFAGINRLLQNERIGLRALQVTLDAGDIDAAKRVSEWLRP